MNLLFLVLLLAVIAWFFWPKCGSRGHRGHHSRSGSMLGGVGSEHDCGCGAAYKLATAHHGNVLTATVANAQCMVDCHGSGIDPCGCVAQYEANLAAGMSIYPAQQAFWTCAENSNPESSPGCGRTFGGLLCEPCGQGLMADIQ
jgi:hypothetical protein